MFVCNRKSKRKARNWAGGYLILFSIFSFMIYNFADASESAESVMGVQIVALLLYKSSQEGTRPNIMFIVLYYLMFCNLYTSPKYTPLGEQ
uniref:Uncharacterized protein n=1 Tax=Anopheles aquasalis TaxID=42839 RepID=T1DHW4_ANOAQ